MSRGLIEIDEQDLPDPFREGLRTLRGAYPEREIEVLVGVDNFVVVSLGTFAVSHRDVPYVHDQYEVFGRLPRNFPSGNVKGFGTSPPLDREDQSVQNNPGWTPEVQSPLNSHLDREEPVEWYSWDWSENPPNHPEDMASAVGHAQQMIQHG